MNMRDVAARANVSSATVSRVINGSSLVKADTAKRIQALLDEVGFIPNPSATTLKYGRSKTLGLIIPDICNPFYSEFLGAFEDLLVEMDQEVLLTSVQSDEKLVKSIRRMLMRQVDGVVMMASEFDTRAIEPLLRHKIPIVTVDRRRIEAGCSDVAVGFEQGFADAVQHLHELGHRKLGYIGGTAGLQTSKIRARAFRQALATFGLEFREEWTAVGNYRVNGGEEAIAGMMKQRNRPTAILTANDLTAFGVMRGLHTLNLSVPSDVSLVGLDDILLTEVTQPSLTTLRIPRKRLASSCVKAMEFTKAHVSQPGRKFTVSTELVVRESTMALQRRSR